MLELNLWLCHEQMKGGNGFSTEAECGELASFPNLVTFVICQPAFLIWSTLLCLYC